MTNIFNVGGARVGVQVLPKPNSHFDGTPTVQIQVQCNKPFFGALLLELVFPAGFNLCL